MRQKGRRCSSSSETAKTTRQRRFNPLKLPLGNTTVVHLNLGLEERERWQGLYQQAGAASTLLYDLAATRSLRQAELQEDLESSN